MIPALVLTAGLGTRLRPLSYVRAKGALPLAGEPLARRILRWLGSAGVTDAVLNLHHMPHTLTREIGDGSDLGMRVRYSWESPVLGSAGGPKRALPLMSPVVSGFSRTEGSSSVVSAFRRTADEHGAFLIVNGDTLTNVDLKALLVAHQSSGALVTMAVIPNTEPDKYGGITATPDGHLTGFVPRGSKEPSFHFIGVQVATPDAFADAPANAPSEVRSLYPALAHARPGAVRIFKSTAEFLDIGTPADYLQTALLIAQREPARPIAGARAVIEADTRIERSVLWDDVVVEKGAMLRECVVADGVTVPADTSWHGVSLRVATGDLAPGEKIIDGLAVCALDRS
jgi:NDP-sugar pyrophosphorylase family protein